MPADEPNNIDLRLDLSEVTISFKTALEFIQWLDNQVNEIKYIDSISRFFPFIAQSYHILLAENNKYLARRTNRLQNPADQADEELVSIKNTMQVIKNLYLEKKLIEPKSANDNFITELREGFPQHSSQNTMFLAFCYVLLCDIPEEQKYPSAIPANLISHYVHAKLVVNEYISVNEHAAEAISNSLINMKKEWEIRNRKLFDEYANRLESLNTQLVQLQEEHQKVRKNEQEKTESLIKQFDDLVITAEEDLEKFKSTYDNELALKAPTTYWTEQKNKYLKQCYGFGAITFLLIIGLGYVITDVAKLEGLTKISEISVFHLSLLILSTTVSVWLVQLCAKMFLSRFQLHTEASLRITTIKTYLSLKKEGNANQENFNFMLRQIFAPLKTGLTKEKDITDSLSAIVSAMKKP